MEEDDPRNLPPVQRLSDDAKQRSIDERSREINTEVMGEIRREQEEARIHQKRVGDAVGTGGDKLYARRSSQLTPRDGTPGYTSFLNKQNTFVLNMSLPG